DGILVTEEVLRERLIDDHDVARGENVAIVNVTPEQQGNSHRPEIAGRYEANGRGISWFDSFRRIARNINVPARVGAQGWRVRQGGGDNTRQILNFPEQAGIQPGTTLDRCNEDVLAGKSRIGC